VGAVAISATITQAIFGFIPVSFYAIRFHFFTCAPNGYITCVVAGVEPAFDADTSDAWEMSLEAADSTTSGACFVRRLLNFSVCSDTPSP